MLLSLATLALGLPGTGCKHFECTAHGGREVRALTSEHFIVTSDLPRDELLAETERLELLWDTFAAFFHADLAEASIPVVLLGSTSDVDSFAPGYAGFVSRSDPDVLVVGAPSEPGQTNVNAHELTHLVSAYLLPRQPRWVAEGLAAYFEDATFHGARTVRMGRWNPSRAEEAFVVGVASLDELNAWGGLSFDDREVNLYASAWAWIHYLANHDEARLARLFAALNSPAPLAQVMAEVFPPAEAARLRDEVQAYMKEARFRGYETSLRRIPAVRGERVLAPWEVHLLRSQLWLRDEGAARADLEQAVALAPSPRPAAVEVVAAQLEHRPLAALVARFPDSPEVLVQAHSAGEKLDAALVSRAVEGHGTNAALLLVAADVAGQDGRGDDMEAFAARGFELAPWSLRLAMMRIVAASARGHCEEAARRLSVAEGLLPERLTQKARESFRKLQELVSRCQPAAPSSAAPP
ncbi:MAG: DUF1570 domain-containing protein [Myxococcota bacterium]